MRAVEIVGLPEPGLGNQSYLIGVGDGDAAVIDPARAPDRYLAAAQAHGWRIRWAVETHLHADFVSGSGELAAYGATVAVPAGAGVGFAADELDDGDQRSLGGLTLEAVATPGHTPEHLAYLLRDGDEVVAVFSGGTLIVGGVARPDLISPDRTEPLARAAWRSITQRLLVLPDDTPLYPTHGPGSFCSAGPTGKRSSTIGEQRDHNPLLQARDENAFVEALLSSLGSFPHYFLRLRPVNAAGPQLYGPQPAPPPQLSTQQVRRRAEGGAELVDLRPIEAFAAGHVPGSLANPLRDQFGVWLGWLVALDRELILITDGDRDQLDRAVRECLKIGHEHLVGHLPFATWPANGHPVAHIPLLAPQTAAATSRRIVDVRQTAEWATGHLPGATHIELAAIAQHPDLPAGEAILTHCGHGERAMTAASLLTRTGHHDVAVLTGSPNELATATNQPLEKTR